MCGHEDEDDDEDEDAGKLACISWLVTDWMLFAVGFVALFLLLWDWLVIDVGS